MFNSQWGKDYSAFLKSDRWKLIRARILNYYGKKCKCCGTMAGHIQVHHLNYERYKNPKLSDVTVLCEDCHREVTSITRSGKFKGAYAVAYHRKRCKKGRK